MYVPIHENCRFLNVHLKKECSFISNILYDQNSSCFSNGRLGLTVFEVWMYILSQESSYLHEKSDPLNERLYFVWFRDKFIQVETSWYKWNICCQEMPLFKGFEYELHEVTFFVLMGNLMQEKSQNLSGK